MIAAALITLPLASTGLAAGLDQQLLKDLGASQQEVRRAYVLTEVLQQEAEVCAAPDVFEAATTAQRAILNMLERNPPQEWRRDGTALTATSLQNHNESENGCEFELINSHIAEYKEIITTWNLSVLADYD
jgi:hypothetical protein